MTVVLCRQDVEAPGNDVRSLAIREDGSAWCIRGELALDGADLERWVTLSPGERRRWQIGTALAREPRVLVLDEPTNHLDAEGRALVLAALGRFRGVGILVSHDRALLEALTTRTARLHHGPLTLNGRRLRRGEGDLDRGGRPDPPDPGPGEGGGEPGATCAGAARSARSAAERSMGGSKLDRKDHDARSMGTKNRRAAAEVRLGADVRRLRTVVDRASAAVRQTTVDVELGRSVFLGYQPAPRPIILSLDEPELRAG